VSPRSRVIAVTAVAAVVVAALVVGIAAVQTDVPAGAADTPRVRPGAPPLTLELGVRADPEAVALRRAARLYADGSRPAAARGVARSTPRGPGGQAFAGWPDGTVDRLNRLAGLHSQKAVVQLNLGVALAWSGLAGAEEAWRAAAASEPDTPYAIAAGNLLHPEYARGIPIFVTTVPLPAGLDALAPAAQLELLERGASASADGKLLYGVALQRLGRQLSAAEVFDAARAEAPANVEAQVAAAVARFDNRRLTLSSWPTRRFPNQSTGRFTSVSAPLVSQ
jgi:hypothetical protein